MTKDIKDPIEREYVESKSIMDMMGIGQTPTDPIKAAKSSYHYQLAKDRFYKADAALKKTFEQV